MKHTTTFKGVEVGYTRQGVGDCLVLLHGFLEDASMWSGIAEKLMVEFDIICVELLGNGASGCTGYVHTVEEQAELVQTILNVEQIEECVVLGHSMGGYVALAFAELYASKLKAFGLFFSTAYADSTQKKLERERAAKAVMNHHELFVEMTIPKLFIDERSTDLEKIISEYVESAKRQPQQGIIANIRGMKERPDRTHILRKGDKPVLYIHGNSDPVIPNHLAKEQVKDCSHITTHFLEGVGHMGHEESPDICAKAIEDFMKKI